ncbi:integrator complex subunit 2 [Gilbertella persicaria]|uniref:integrator complex subunit 2 n=1 Tax=Gilbertella persicaria TaxID=101096 RepID=UPI00221FDC80|nr:integrator complex subunit 2 [Gilbertella persicaria]KAI8092453.1 integrator complex subunit 2 [Gilbertella persicaria]
MIKKSFDLDSFYQLLKARVFHNIDYQTWLLNSMNDATLPIHPKFSLVIDEFVQSIFLTDQCQKIPEEIIQPYFDDCTTISPTQILVLLYILTFNDYIIAFRTEPKLVALSSNNSIVQEEYSNELLDRIPIRYILDYVELQARQPYKAIYSDLLALAANLFPEFFDVQSFLIQEGKDVSWDHHTRPKTMSLDQLQHQLNQWELNPATTIEALSFLETIAAPEKEGYISCMLSTLVDPCLANKLDDRIAEAFRSTWETFNRVIPHTLWAMTINYLIPETSNYTLNDLNQDIHIVFKCDSRIFRSEQLLPIWLHILSCLRTMSRHRIWKRYHTHFSRPENHSINSRNVMALVNAQDSFTIQLLLELCLAKPKDKDNQDALEKSRKLICDFIHTIFIDGDRDMLLAKILHFQTYSTDLIPVVVKLIPSLYIVLSFIPELTRQPQLEKQVFGILIACHLCEKYPLENYLITAEKHVLPRLLRIAFPLTREGQPSNVCVPSEFLVKAIPGFVHLARAFPHFGPKILSAFDDIAKGLPEPKQFIGQEGNSKIILVLQLHAVLKDSREQVETEVRKMDLVNKVIL